MNTKDIYSELSSLLCNQDRVLKDLILTLANNRKVARPKNVLLVGPLGSGKTTMVQLAANRMDIPLAEVSGFCTFNGVNSKVLYDAFSKLYVLNERNNCFGIVLIHDMRECFLYGGLSALESLITSAMFTYENHFLDLSKTMFIGEVDNNGFEDCFLPKPEYTLDRLEEAIMTLDYSGDEVKRIIEDLVSFGDEIDDVEEVYTSKYRTALRNTFLSVECNKAFHKRIFMDNMKLEDIKKALNSPISELKVYSDDLCEEYMTSPRFINSVASHIKESMVGLHDLDAAVAEVADFDNSRKVKVYKDNSLMRL